MTKIVLFDYAKSSAAYRVRIGLNLKGAAYESRQVNLLDSEQKGDAYRAFNPQGFVPMLEVDGHRIMQSLAILVYLDQVFAEPRLMPVDPFDGAHVRAMAMTIACDIHPLNNLRVLKYLSGPLALDQAQRDAWYSRWVSDGFEALEAMAKPRAGGFLFGDAPTLADVCLVPQMFNARRFNVPIDRYPTLLRADENARALPAFAEAHPDKQEQPR
jgi:maleylacetoacetate isomerase